MQYFLLPRRRKRSAPDGQAPWLPGSTAVCTPLPSPADIIRARPLAPGTQHAVLQWRAEARAILDGRDDRLLVIAGPCSLHDKDAALDYASRLAVVSRMLGGDLMLVMRAFPEKPRTVTGWKGIARDPRLDGSSDIAAGLAEARDILAGIAETGVPAAIELLTPLVIQCLADTLAWGAVGARTCASQEHRERASGLPIPVGIKNSPGGSIQAAVDACLAAAGPAVFPGAGPDGGPASVATRGNPDCHIVLRGSDTGPNHGPEHVEDALRRLRGAGLPPRVVIDAAHANSGKDHLAQPGTAEAVAAQVAAGRHEIRGIMLESNLVPGRQEPGPGPLAYGQSVTDACMGFDATAGVLDSLAGAVRARRASGGTR